MITLQVVTANSIKEKMQGLIGKKKAYSLLLKTRFGIHTFGLQFPIDVVVLDKSSKVVKLKENLQPRSFYFWHPRWNTIVELPGGFIAEKKIHWGDVISLSY